MSPYNIRRRDFINVTYISLTFYTSTATFFKLFSLKSKIELDFILISKTILHMIRVETPVACYCLQMYSFLLFSNVNFKRSS